MASQGGTSRLAQMQMRFQQKQQQEREQRKMEITETRGVETTDGNSLNSSVGPGKVRQMFDERRQRSTGIDKSYPLKPIAPRSSPASTTITKSTTTVRKQASMKEINGYISSTNSETRERIIRNGEDSGKTSLNGNTVMSNNQYCVDSIENEQFPDTCLPLDNEMLGLTISAKLPNVGKLTLNENKNRNGVMGDRNNNNKNTVVNRTPNANNIKLKPVVTKKTPISDGQLRGNRRVIDTFKSRNSPTPPRISSPIVEKSTPLGALRKPIAKTPPSSSLSTVKKVPTSRTTTIKPNPRVSTPPDNMAACRICGRHFNEDRIEKHQQICQKTTTKKRKVFDVSKQRVQGTEAEQYVRKIGKTPNSRAAAVKTTSSGASSNKKSDWRKKHEEFIQAIRAAKDMKTYLARGGKLSDLPPPPPSENPDYVQCPHCSRRFNEAAATRHIPKCATMLHNKSKPALKKKR